MFRSNYAIGDFLLFSERVYDRMFELYNIHLWPLHVVAILVGLFVVWVAINPRPQTVRLALGLLSVTWLFVAVVFLYGRYAAINWAVVYTLPLFVLVAIVLAVWAMRSDAPGLEQRSGFAFFVAVGVLIFSIVGYPLLGFATGRHWMTAEVFGMTPEPTVIATLAFLALVRRGRALTPMLVASLWTVVTALTLYALDRSDFFVGPLAAVLCIAAYIIGTRRHQTSATKA